MKRKQIYIEEGQERELKRIAKERGCSEAELVRDAVDRLIETSPPPQLSSMKEHPLWAIVGIVGDPDAPTDGSVNHDHYLYGGPKKWRVTKAGKLVRNWPRQRRVR
jgi:hypothetical protein